MENEIWRDVPNYEGVYQVSNLGNVKSLNYNKTKKERLLKLTLCGGYLLSYFYSDGKVKKFRVHQLVAMAFLGHEPCGHKVVVDHKNNNPFDNRLENLQLISHRENCSKDKKNKTSKYKGVSWSKNRNKWVSSIRLNGGRLFLGYFKCETTASLVYQNKLKELAL